MSDTAVHDARITVLYPLGNVFIYFLPPSLPICYRTPPTAIAEASVVRINCRLISWKWSMGAEVALSFNSGVAFSQASVHLKGVSLLVRLMRSCYGTETFYKATIVTN